MLKAYGAEVILTNPALTIQGAIDRANELQKLIPNSIVLNQFANEANILAHYETTGYITIFKNCHKSTKILV